MSRPTISAILTFYRNDAWFAEALASVRAQSEPPDEILVIDDASPEDESRSLSGLPKDVRIIRLPRNSGPGAARALATTEARGDLVAYLDCDDLWLPDKLRRQRELMILHPEASSCHTATAMFFADGSERRFLDKPERCIARDSVLASNMLPSCFMAWRQAVLDAGNWSPDRNLIEDWDLEIRITDRVGPMLFVPEVLMRFRRFDQGNLSGKVLQSALRLGRTIIAHRKLTDRLHRRGMWRRVFAREMTSHGHRVGGAQGAALRFAGRVAAIGTPAS